MATLIICSFDFTLMSAYPPNDGRRTIARPAARPHELDIQCRASIAEITVATSRVVTDSRKSLPFGIG